MFKFYFSSDAELGTDQDTQKLVCQLLNRSLATRTITKQESMCEVGGLPMVVCSEIIETVSISGAVKFRENAQDYTSSTFFFKYYHQNPHYNCMSLHQYFDFIRNTSQKHNNKHRQVVPHYVGGAGQPKYPVTQSYARATLLIYKPWSVTNPLPTEDKYIASFEKFITSSSCPYSVKLSYERAKLRTKQTQCGIPESFHSETDQSTPTTNIYDKDIKDAMELSNCMINFIDTFDSIQPTEFDYGKNFDWGHRRQTNVSENSVLILTICTKH
jgi:hypothetical protein